MYSCKENGRLRLVLGLVVLLGLPAHGGEESTPTNNTALIARHATGSAVSIGSIPGGVFAPWPFSVGFEIAGFGADLGVVNLPAVFEAPLDKTFFPNAVASNSRNGTSCRYQFTQPVVFDADAATPVGAEYSGFFAIPFQTVQDSFGDLGAPQKMYHAGGDVQVSAANAFLSATEPQANGLAFPSLPSGSHTISWEAQTLLNPLFDLVIPPILITATSLAEYRTVQKAAAASAKAASKGAKATAQAVKKNVVKEIFRDVAIEFGLYSADRALNDFLADTNIPTGINRDTQQIRVWDEAVPYIAKSLLDDTPISEQSFTLEATDFGGVRFSRVRSRLLREFVAIDDCGKSFTNTTDVAADTIFPVGQTSTVEWLSTEVDGGPYLPGNGISLAGNQSRSGEQITTSLTQRIIVQDTQPPILAVPAGFAAERTTPLPAADILTREFPVGRPLVVDLADPRPSVGFTIVGEPVQLELDQRYLLNWFAEDVSGNATNNAPLDQSQFQQLVTIKTPGTNNAPSAQPAAAFTNTSKPVEILLQGSDPDVLDGIADPLRFEITDYPANGDFEAPILPFFIHDFRLTPNGSTEPGDVFSRVSPLGFLAEGFSNQPNQAARTAFLGREICSAAPGSQSANRFNNVIPVDFVAAPTRVQVADNGNLYFEDRYFYCTTNGSAEVGARISLFTDETELLAMVPVNAQQNPASGSEQIIPPWAAEIGLSGNESFRLEGRSFSFDSAGNLYPTFRWLTGPTLADVQICSTVYQLGPQLDDARSLGQGCSPQGGEFVFGVLPDLQNDVNVIVRSRPGPDGQLFDDFVLGVYDAGASNVYGTEGHIGDIIAPPVEVVGSFSRAIDREGAVYFLDRTQARIHKYSPTTRGNDGQWRLGEYVGWLGKCVANKVNALGVPFNACNETAEISNGYACTENKCTIPGTDTNRVTGSRPGQLFSPEQLAVDPRGILYVADTGNFRIQRFTPDGTFAGEAVSEASPGGVNRAEFGDFVIGNFGRPANVSVNSSGMYTLDSYSPFIDVFLHAFRTAPFFEVTDSSAKVKYVSEFNFQGADQFSYRVDDGLAFSTAQPVDVSVSRSFRSPERLYARCFQERQAQFEVPCETAEDGAGLFIRAAARDPDGFIGAGGLDQLTVTVRDTVRNGLLEALEPTVDGQWFRYVPDEHYNGPDSFSFSITDGFTPETAPFEVALRVSPTPDPVQVEWPEELVAARGFPVTIAAPYSDVDEDAIQPELLSLRFSDTAISTAAQNWENSGNLDPNNREISPQTHYGRGRGMLMARHTYASTGTKQLVATLSNAAEGLPNTVSIKSVSVQDATIVSAVLDAPRAPVNPGQILGLEFVVTNQPPDGWAGLSARDIQLAIDLPEGVNLVTPDPRCSGASLLTCALGTLIPDASTTVSIGVEISLEAARENASFAIPLTIEDAGPKITDVDVGMALLEIADNDGDGTINVDDAFEEDARYISDTDGDGLADAWEIRFGYDPEVADNASADPDGDGLSLLEEFQRDSLPELADVAVLAEQRRLTALVPQVGSHFGVSIAAADFNQDGFSDTAVGADLYDGGAGAVFIYYGAAEGEAVGVTVLKPTNSNPRRFGRRLAVADFDGNGFPDLLVNGENAAQLYYSSGELLATPDATYNIAGPAIAVQFATGTLDNDDIPDLFATYCIASTGTRALKFYLSERGVDASGEPNAFAASPVVIDDGQPCETRAALIDDLDGDGLNDVVVGANASRVHIYFGRSIDWANPGNLVPTRIISAPAGQSIYGYSLASGADIGGDGVNDLLVGAIGGTSARGWVNVYDSSDVYWEGTASQRQPSLIIEGRNGLLGGNDLRGDSLGASLTMGDVDQDNFVDLILGASRAGSDDRGEVLIYRGNGNGFGGSGPFDLAGRQVIQGAPQSNYGGSIVMAGDVDGDGIGDVAVAAPSGSDGGRVALLTNRYVAANPADDQDGDGVRDSADNCPEIANTNRGNADGDALGDVCDPDADNDSMDNIFERAHGLDELVNDAGLDLDGDGLSNLDEFNRGTSPSDSDTDRDGIADGDEIGRGSDPLFADTDNDGIGNLLDADDDADGLLDSIELALGLDPLDIRDALADSDGDGFSNLAEFIAGSGVLDSGSVPELGLPSPLFASVLPGHRSTQTGRAVSAFATIINDSGATLENCALVPQTALAASWRYAPTNPATNAVDGEFNRAVSIGAGAAQSYVFELNPLEPLATELPLFFHCDGVAAARALVGINTFGITATLEGGVDMVALSATASQDGVLRIPGAPAAGAFALASVNVGQSGALSARVSATGNLPLVLGICETNPATGLCQSGQAPRAEWLLNVEPNATPTFSVFASAIGDIPLDPASNRVFVEFFDASGGRVGASSVAVTTGPPQ